MRKLLVLFLLLPALAGAQSPAPTTSLPATQAPESPGQSLQDTTLAAPLGLSPALPRRPEDRRLALLRKLAIPATLIAVGFAGSGHDPLIPYNEEIHEEIEENYRSFHTNMDNYTRQAPIVAVYALNLAGIKGRHDLYNLTAIYLMADFLNTTATLKLKSLTSQLRPDRSSADAFPSGHTSGAFTAATILFLEYKDQSIWYGVGGYGIAAATGGLRMLKNKHWLSDVVAGAGVGILSTEVAYTIYPWIQKKICQGLPRASSQRLMILPGYAFQAPAISLLYTFK